MPPPPPNPPPPPSPPPVVITIDNAGGANSDAFISTIVIAIGGFIAAAVIAYIIWKRMQRVKIRDMKHLKAVVRKIDPQVTDEIDTADFCRALNIPMDVWSNRLVRMMDLNADGFISFDGLVAALARFHDCKGTRGVNVGYRLMDAEGTGSVKRKDLVQILRAVLPDVQRKVNVFEREAYSTRKVLKHVKKHVSDPVQVEDLDNLETTFPGIMKDATYFFEQFKNVFVPCKELIDSGDVEGGVDSEPASGASNKIAPA